MTSPVRRRARPDRIKRVVVSTGRTAVSDGDHADAFHFGERLRAFRKRRGWSLEKAAKMVGVPGSTLSRIENRKMSPTLELIQKIVRSMGLHPYDVLSRDAKTDRMGAVSVTRSGEAEYTELPNILYAPLHPDFSHTAMRPILVTLFARSVEEYGGVTAHPGEEFLYIVQGSAEIIFDGRPAETLKEGDSILFDSHIAHAYVSVGRSQAKLLIVASTIDTPFSQKSEIQDQN
jgi:transcriptional regulator with XRE-family HTH domain